MAGVMHVALLAMETRFAALKPDCFACGKLTGTQTLADTLLLSMLTSIDTVVIRARLGCQRKKHCSKQRHGNENFRKHRCNPYCDLLVGIDRFSLLLFPSPPLNPRRCCFPECSCCSKKICK